MTFNAKQVEEIQNTIRDCELFTKREGSAIFHDSLIAKFSVIDPSFSNGLPEYAKTYSEHGEPDFRPEIKAIAEKLKMMLISAGFSTESKSQKLHQKIGELIIQGHNIGQTEYIDTDDFMPSYIEGAKYNTWVLEIELICERYFKTHPLYKTIMDCNKHKGDPEYVKKIINSLEIIDRDTDFFSEQEELKTIPKEKSIDRDSRGQEHMNKKRIFIVHGHDEEMKQSVARILEKAGLEPIILHEKANEGKTIIEKFEKHSDVCFAIVLYSPCDIGRASGSNQDAERPRARQNVVFEHGFLVAKLGRDRVCALVKGDLETPSDTDGILYIPMNGKGAWKTDIARELEEAKIQFDFKKMIL